MNLSFIKVVIINIVITENKTCPKAYSKSYKKSLGSRTVF